MAAHSPFALSVRTQMIQRAN